MDRGDFEGLGGLLEHSPLQSHSQSAICPGVVNNPSESVQCKPLEVSVGDKGIERAIKHLKRKMAGEGTLRELKRRRHYQKPSIKKRKKIAEAARRRRKRDRQPMMGL